MNKETSKNLNIQESFYRLCYNKIKIKFEHVNEKNKKHTSKKEASSTFMQRIEHKREVIQVDGREHRLIRKWEAH